MLPATYLPVADPLERPRAIDGFGPMGTAVLTTVGILLVVAAIAVGAVFVALEAVQYLRLNALDDYRDGYAVGETLTSGESTGSCGDAMSGAYDSREDVDGWHAFLAGCRDATSGRAALPWYDLRGNLGATGSWPGSD